MDAAGLTDGSAMFRDSVKEQPYLGPLYSMLKYQGLVCWRGSADHTRSTSYGWSPLTDEQARTERSALAADSSLTATVDGDITRYLSVDQNTAYVVGSGWWALSYNNGGGSVIEDLVVTSPR